MWKSVLYFLGMKLIKDMQISEDFIKKKWAISISIFHKTLMSEKKKNFFWQNCFLFKHEKKVIIKQKRKILFSKESRSQTNHKQECL